jgi:hypothetical protein
VIADAEQHGNNKDFLGRRAVEWVAIQQYVQLARLGAAV